MKNYKEIKIANTLNSQIVLPVHEYIGSNKDIKLGIICTVHGDETFPAFFFKKFF